MSLVLWKNRAPLAPWRAFQDLERELDCLWQRTPTGERAWTPAVDVKETDEAYIIEADLPGVKQEEIELTVNGDQVTLKGERKHEEKVDKDGYHRVERRYGTFQRTFEVPGGFDHAKVDAQYRDGELTVTLPKREEAKPREIQVKVK